MKRVGIIALLILVIPLAHAVSFNEIMYDVIGSDDGEEWLEIINEDNSTVDLQGWKFYEAGVNHNIVSISSSILLPGEMAVIAEDAQEFLVSNPNFTGKLFDSSFSLSNTGETLVLKNKTGQVKDNITYSYIVGGDENGFSLGIYNAVWKETFPTPGKKNTVSNACDWKVSIQSDKLIFEDKTDFSWKVVTEKILGEASLVTIRRTISDIYGNQVKTYSELNHDITNRETLSYDPNLNPGTYLLRTEISPGCNDTNLANNIDQRLVAVKEQTQNNNKESKLEILRLYDLGKDEKAEFGQLIKARVKAYRGDTSKQTISLWIENSKEKISKVLDFKIPEKYSEQELTIPIQIFSNCKNKLDEGTYSLILEGLGKKDSIKFEAFNTDEDCIKTVVKETSESAPKISSTELSPGSTIFKQQRPYSISTIVFESSQKKAENMVTYAIAFITSLAAVFLVLSNKALP